MPRKGKGQKVTTVPGQTYGAQTAQAEAQAVVPLAEMQSPATPGPPPTPRPRPGELGVSLTGPSIRPDESIMRPSQRTQLQPVASVDMRRYRFQAAAFEALASAPSATPTTRMIARMLRSAIPEGD